MYTTLYPSPIGLLLIKADDTGLTSISFIEDTHNISIDNNIPILKDIIHYLDTYFKGIKPDTLPSLHMIGTTYQKEVWNLLLDIDYGHTITYGELSLLLSNTRGYKTSPRAIGQAVGHNPLLIIVPCHRVIGKSNIGGYRGGIDRKRKLLLLESGNECPLSYIYLYAKE